MGPVVCVVSDMWGVSGMWGPWYVQAVVCGGLVVCKVKEVSSILKFKEKHMIQT